MLWQDSPSNDYISRPDIDKFNNIASYEFTMYFKKTFKRFKQMEDVISASASVGVSNDGVDEKDMVGINACDRFKGQVFLEEKDIQSIAPWSIFLCIDIAQEASYLHK